MAFGVVVGGGTGLEQPTKTRAIQGRVKRRTGIKRSAAGMTRTALVARSGTIEARLASTVIVVYSSPGFKRVGDKNRAEG